MKTALALIFLGLLVASLAPGQSDIERMGFRFGPEPKKPSAAEKKVAADKARQEAARAAQLRQEQDRLASRLTRNPEDGGGRDAYHAGRRAVERFLKSPASASFSDLTDRTTGWLKHGWEQWRVGGQVDAQNSFGAVVREHWEAVVRRANGRFDVIHLRIGDQIKIGSTSFPSVALAPPSIQASNQAVLNSLRQPTNAPSSSAATALQ